MLITAPSLRLRQRGFTLIEAMITIAILAIVIALGMPSFRAMVQNARIRAAAESILAGLQKARAEAVGRNTNVRFAFPTAGRADWVVTLPMQSPIQELQSSIGEGSASITVTPRVGASATFNGLGRLRNNLDSASTPSFTQIDIDSTALSAAESRNLSILLASGGEVRICDPNIAVPSDPRSC